MSKTRVRCVRCRRRAKTGETIFCSECSRDYCMTCYDWTKHQNCGPTRPDTAHRHANR